MNPVSPEDMERDGDLVVRRRDMRYKHRTALIGLRLSPATAKAAASAGNKLATRLSPRGVERPQADGRAGLRLRRRPRPAHAEGRHQHPRAEETEEEGAGARSDASVARWAARMRSAEPAVFVCCRRRRIWLLMSGGRFGRGPGLAGSGWRSLRCRDAAKIHRLVEFACLMWRRYTC